MTSVNRQPTASMASACGRAARARADRAWPSDQRVALVEQSLAVERGDDRGTEPPATAGSRRRPRPRGAAAGQDDRPLGRGQHRGGLSDGLRRHGAARARRKPEQIGVAPCTACRIRSWGKKSAAGRGRPGVIAWNAWPTMRRDLLAPADGAAPLGDRPEDALEVDLVIVAAFPVQVGRIDLTGQEEHGHRVGPGFGHARQGVGRPRAGGGADHPGTPVTRA